MKKIKPKEIKKYLKKDIEGCLSNIYNTNKNDKYKEYLVGYFNGILNCMQMNGKQLYIFSDNSYDRMYVVDEYLNMKNTED